MKEITPLDVLVLISLVFMICTKIITVAYISHISEISEVQITKVSNLYEANPVIRWIINLTGIQMLMSTLLIPAFMFSLYYFFRRRYMKDKLDIDILSFYVTFVFLLTLLNIINDATIFLAKII